MRVKIVVAVLVAFGISAVLWHAFSPSNQGCPSGTTPDQTVLTLVCDRADGSTACVMWADGFTPDARHQERYVRQYVPSVPLVGPWCSKATAPPSGLG